MQLCFPQIIPHEIWMVMPGRAYPMRDLLAAAFPRLYREDVVSMDLNRLERNRAYLERISTDDVRFEIRPKPESDLWTK